MPAEDGYAKIYENDHEEVNEFIRRKRHLDRSERTLNEYSRILQRFFHDQFPECTPQEITVRHIEEYVQALDERGVSQNTKKRYLEALSSFYGYAMQRPHFEDITGNPAGVILEEIPSVRRERPDCATWENATAIVHHIPDPRDKTVAIVLAKTGARLREALSIRQDDVLLEDGFVRLSERKGGGQTVVPIDKETIHAIKRFRFIRVETESPYLFVSRRGDRLCKERIRRAVKEAADRAGVADRDETRFEKKFTPHTFRTVFTTLMRNEGMKRHTLQYIRGDAPSDTMDIYTRVDRDAAREEYLACIKPLNIS